MTITQLKIILMTAQHGSISGAARELGIPQPNASSGIKAVEQELGFPIFNRTSGGIAITEKGKLFLVHAQKILDETERIDKLGTTDRVYQLRVGCTNYYRGRDAFIRLCEKHTDEELADLQYYNVSFEKGIQLLYEHKLDVVIGLTLDTLLPTTREMCIEKKLNCITADTADVALTLGKNHPLVTGGAFDNGINLSLLSQYPYVAYHSLNADFDTPYYKAAFPIPCKYAIYIEERETRFRLVRDTNAFMFGGSQPREILDYYDLVEYSYPAVNAEIICIYRDIDEDREEVREFIDII